jgi:exodeoxyribonuclease V alpha subunit
MEDKMPVIAVPASEEIVLNGKVVHLFYQSSGFTAGVLKHESEGRVRFNGKFMVSDGDEVSLVGHWSNHPQYGKQFSASGLKQELPISVDGLAQYLAKDPAFVNIGETKGRLIAETFGATFDYVIREEAWKIAKVAHLSQDTLDTLCKVWLQRSEMNALSSWIGSFGLTHRQITRLVENLGHNAKALLMDNPYELCRILPGFGFIRVDEIAQKIGIDKKHPARIAAAFRHILLKAEQDGHCWLEEEVVIDSAYKMLYLDNLQARHEVAELLDKEVNEERLFRVDGGGRCVISLPSLAVREIDILKKITYVNSESWEIPMMLLSLIDEETTLLNESQREAALMVFKHRISLIAGAAGSGKSFTIAAIYRCLRKIYNEEDIALAAPTGKAAKRLENLCNSDAKTIHRLLEYNTTTWGRNHNKPLKESVVITDEMSMTDVNLMWHLLDAIDFNTTQLIIVGDNNQLPSVGPGNILRDLLMRKLLPIVVLDQVVRQAGVLKENCTAILQGHVHETSDGVCGVLRPWYLLDDCRDEHAVLTTLEELIKDIIPRLGIDPVRDLQVLTPTNKGPLGTRSLNILIQRIIQEQQFNVVVPSVPENRRPEIFIGDKVMQIRNNYDLELMNGAIGFLKDIVTELDEDTKSNVTYLVLDFDGRMVRIRKDSDSVDDLVLAYASTIHKSQGSEFPVVIAVIHHSQSFMLNRNLLYTAVTRAQQSAIIVGNAVGVRRAVDRRDVNARKTYLSLLNPKEVINEELIYREKHSCLIEF